MALPDFYPGQTSIPAEQMQELADSARRFNAPLGGVGNNFFSSSIGDIQQGLPPDNWWIQITDGPVSGSGSGTGAKRAAYGWVTVQRQGTEFIVMNDMPSGTSSAFPAYEQNGNLDVPLGTVVRAWVTSDQGLPCMEFEYCCGDDTGDSGACIQKVLVSNCWQGTTLKQIFNLYQGCKIIGTSCEDVPNCGSGCGSGSGIPSITPCPCYTQAYPLYFTFSFPSYLTQVALPSPTKWCLGQCTPVGPSTGGCCYVSSNLVGNGAGQDAFWLARIQVNSDGSATLLVSNAVADVQASWRATYYVSTWNCNASNTLTLIDSEQWTGNLPQLSFPGTVTVNTASDASFCSGGGGSANDCASCAKTSWTLHMNGAAGCALTTNNSCTGCTGLDSSSPYTLTETGTGSCVFTSGITGVFLTCGVSTPAITFTLFDTGIGWELDIEQGGIVKMSYFLDYASWNCAGGNLMPATVNYGGGCNWPNCVVVDV